MILPRRTSDQRENNGEPLCWTPINPSEGTLSGCDERQHNQDPNNGELIKLLRQVRLETGTRRGKLAKGEERERERGRGPGESRSRTDEAEGRGVIVSAERSYSSLDTLIEAPPSCDGGIVLFSYSKHFSR